MRVFSQIDKCQQKKNKKKQQQQQQQNKNKNKRGGSAFRLG